MLLNPSQLRGEIADSQSDNLDTMFYMTITSYRPISVISCGQGKMDTSEQGDAESDDAEHSHEKRVFRSCVNLPEVSDQFRQTPCVLGYRHNSLGAACHTNWKPRGRTTSYNNLPALNILLGTSFRSLQAMSKLPMGDGGEPTTSDLYTDCADPVPRNLLRLEDVGGCWMVASCSFP